MTVYKAVRGSRGRRGAAAIALLKGKTPKTTGTVRMARAETALLLAPVSITKANYKPLFKDRYLKKNDVCVGAYAKYCK